MEDNQVSINIEDTTNEKKSKKGLILVILGLLIIAVGTLLAILFLNKNKAAKLNGKYFEKDTYYSCTPDTKNDGPMQYYMELDNKGRYVAVLASPTLYVSAGLYEINDSTLTINEQFTKTYQFPAQESNREYEMTYENGTLKDDSSKCKTISKSEFKESVKEFGYKSYDEMKKSYEEGQKDPNGSKYNKKLDENNTYYIGFEKSADPNDGECDNYAYLILNSEKGFRLEKVFDAAYGHAGTGYELGENAIQLYSNYSTGTGAPDKNDETVSLDIVDGNIIYDGISMKKVTKDEFVNSSNGCNTIHFTTFEDVVEEYNSAQNEE